MQEEELKKKDTFISDNIGNINLAPSLTELTPVNKKLMVFRSICDNSPDPRKYRQTIYLILRGILRANKNKTILTDFSLDLCQRLVHFGYFYEFLSDVRSLILNQRIIDLVEKANLQDDTESPYFYRITPFLYDVYKDLRGEYLEDGVFTERDLDIILALNKNNVSKNRIAKFYNVSVKVILFWIKAFNEGKVDFKNIKGTLADLTERAIETQKKEAILLPNEDVMRNATWYYNKVFERLREKGIKSMPVKDVVNVQKLYISTKTWYEAAQKMKEEELIDEYTNPAELQDILKKVLKYLSPKDIAKSLNIEDPVLIKALESSMVRFDYNSHEKEILSLIDKQIEEFEFNNEFTIPNKISNGEFSNVKEF